MKKETFGKPEDMRPPESSKANSESKSLALILLPDSPVDDPLPLSILHPKLRQSPRLAKVHPGPEENNLHSTPLTLTTPEFLHGSRRLPGVSLPLHDAESSISRRNRGKTSTLVSEQCLRRSTRLRGGNLSGKTTNLGMNSTALCDSSRNWHQRR